MPNNLCLVIIKTWKKTTTTHNSTEFQVLSRHWHKLQRLKWPQPLFREANTCRDTLEQRIRTQTGTGTGSGLVTARVLVGLFRPANRSNKTWDRRRIQGGDGGLHDDFYNSTSRACVWERARSRFWDRRRFTSRASSSVSVWLEDGVNPPAQCDIHQGER